VGLDYQPGTFRVVGDAANHLAAIVDSADDAIVSKDLTGTIVSWNRAAERIFGWSAAEAVGRHISLIIPEERHSEEDDILSRIRRGEGLTHFETERITKHGRCVDISLTISPVRDSSGRVIGASKIARDITERRRLEVERSRLAAIVDSADDAIVSKDLNGVIQSWNRAAERMFGWTAEEAVGRHISVIIPDDRREEEDDIIARIRRGEGLDHFETIRITKDRRLLNISLSVSPIRDAGGRVVGASKIARDVSERRRFEDERNRLLAAAEAANRAKDRLLATVSHELRTPLNSILGYARMLETGELDENARRHAISVIVRSARTQGQLVDDLLDLSRAVTGRMQLTLEPCDLVGIVEGAVDIVRPAADAKGVTLATTFASGVGVLACAPDRIRQVLWNLAINAIKFTPRGGRVDISVRQMASSVEIVMADNGVGIEPTLLPHVFELFRQEDNSITRQHGGLGLGLALVKSLVELHGGTVRAESPGKGLGARFTVMLPVRHAGDPTDDVKPGA
jgi:PAS domain S-box-containing protein